MTTDYSKLDTAALVAAADTLTAGITPGEWTYSGLAIVTHDAHGALVYVVGGSWDCDIDVESADVAFIAAAPALVRELLTRLRAWEQAGLGDTPIIQRFNKGDTLRVIDNGEHEHAGETVKVFMCHYNPTSKSWGYDVMTDTEVFYATEDELERVENG